MTKNFKMFVSQKDFIILYQSCYSNNIFHSEFSTNIDLNGYLVYKKTNLNANCKDFLYLEIQMRIKIPSRNHTNV